MRSLRQRMKVKVCGHFVIDRGGRCEHCFEVIETESPYPPSHPTFEDIRAEAEAKALTEWWNYICECIRKPA